MTEPAAPPLPNTQSTESTMETPRPEEPFNFSREVGRGFLVGGVLSSAYILARAGVPAVWALAPGASCYGAVWWGTYSAIMHARRKEEKLGLSNALAVAGAYGITSLPNGVRAAGRSALLGGAFSLVLQGGLKLLLGDAPQQAGP